MSAREDPYRPLHEQLLGRLAEHRVDFIVIGGVGLQLLGYPEQTTDLDVAIAIDEANQARLHAALAELEARPVRRDGTLAWDTTLGRLEIVENASGIGGYDAWHAEATPRLLGDGTAVRVASGRQIELNKTVAGRQKDLDALPAIRAALIRHGELDPSVAHGPVASSPPAQAPPSTSRVAELALGPRPGEEQRARRWDGLAGLIDAYRSRHGLHGHDSPLGPVEPGAHSDDQRRLQRFVERYAQDEQRRLRSACYPHPPSAAPGGVNADERASPPPAPAPGPRGRREPDIER